MGGQHGHKPTGRIRALFEAQESLCFHCGKPMVLHRLRHQQRAIGWTREHVWPRADPMAYALQNNTVLAHPPCNGARGDRLPTADEIQRTIAIYAKIGETAFVLDASNADRAANQRPRSFTSSTPVTFAEIWPKSALPESG